MSNKSKALRLPDMSNRTVVIGRTGSGKTVASLWLLSTQAVDVMPWVIIDYKGDEEINAIPKAQHIGYEAVPTKPGIYILHPRPGETNNELTEWLWKVYQQENIGLFFDEVFMLGQDNDAFNTIMMQGRSKHLPVISCTQQPVNISTYCFSEANFYMVFDLTIKRHRNKVASEIPINPEFELPDHHFFYYDVGRKKLVTMLPVPEASKSLEILDQKLPITRRFI